MKLVYIHGASATGESFNYIRDRIKHKDLILEYDSHDGFDYNLGEMCRRLTHEESVFFVAHSLGGVYSLHLAQQFPEITRGAVTISTPYGGCKTADFAKWFLPFNQLMRDIGPKAAPMRGVQDIEIAVPWCNIVSTRGSSPFIIEPNDGVVTIDSMKRNQHNMELVEVNYNHYEVMQSEQVVEIIQTRIQRVKNGLQRKSNRSLREST